MPTEYISNEHGPEITGGPETRMRIGWAKDMGQVQVATLADEDVKLEPGPNGNGWFVNLDRYRLNKLIRTLRRARDQAFGKDE